LKLSLPRSQATIMPRRSRLWMDALSTAAGTGGARCSRQAFRQVQPTQGRAQQEQADSSSGFVAARPAPSSPLSVVLPLAHL
jgi:hypothetical protein